MPCVVDPHFSRSPDSFSGGLLKCNEAYAEQWRPSGDVVVTRGPASPWFETQGASGELPPRPPVPVRSVVGAGDCFAAHLALALSHGEPIDLACAFAYSAGRAYVQGEFNRPPLPREVLADTEPLAAKILSAADLCATLAVRLPGRVVFTNGCFDLLHAGHLATLRWARAQGDTLVVGINSDAGVHRLKGPGRPRVPLEHRARLLAALDCVDWVVPFDEPTPEAILPVIGPAVLVKGDEYAGRRVPGDELVPAVLFAPPSGVSYHSSDLMR